MLCYEYIPVVLDDGARLPSRAHPDDAGLDLYSREDVLIPAHGAAVFDTGVHMAIPHGYDGKVTSKSGLCVRNDIVSEAGEIDSNYRGSIRVKLRNHGDKPYLVHAGDKIAQIVVRPVSLAACRVVDALDDSDRGSGGFGSTGK